MNSVYNSVTLVNIAVLYYTVIMAENTTLEKIHNIAITEFLEKGFRGASLREIVKKAGVTTGAFYGYYKSKEELFDSLVKPHADYVRTIFDSCIKEYVSLPKTEWAQHMGDYSLQGMIDMFEYAYNHKDAFLLILHASEGTQWEDFIHKIVEVEIELTHTFYDVIRSQGFTPYSLSPMLEHMIISGEFTGLFELIVHDISREDGLRCVRELHDFYQAAWFSVLKVPGQQHS